MSANGKVVLVTGSNQGIGREVAQDLARQGAEIVLACRNTDAASATADQIRKFAASYRQQGRPLHVLINNAGANYMPEQYTDQGVGVLCQVNYLGPYHLTRLLEPTLIASRPSRVVNVSSIMHRSGHVDKDTDTFLSDWRTGSQYANTKLANVLFTYEAQRRLAPHGVQSCAVDPGAVSSNIYANSRLPRPVRWFIRNLHAPTTDGASAVIHAATAPWQEPPLQQGQPYAPKRSELRFYARGAFASPALGWCSSGNQGLLDQLRKGAWAISAVLHSSLDWPVRRLSGGKLLSRTSLVPSHPQSYDTDLASRLWNSSAARCQVPADPRL